LRERNGQPISKPLFVGWPAARGETIFFEGASKKDKAKLEPKTFQTIPQRKETNGLLSNKCFKFAREKPTNSHIHKQPKTSSKTMF
jgi:hypothetical protein